MEAKRGRGELAGGDVNSFQGELRGISILGRGFVCQIVFFMLFYTEKKLKKTLTFIN